MVTKKKYNPVTLKANSNAEFQNDFTLNCNMIIGILWSYAWINPSPPHLHYRKIYVEWHEKWDIKITVISYGIKSDHYASFYVPTDWAFALEWHREPVIQLKLLPSSWHLGYSTGSHASSTNIPIPPGGSMMKHMDHQKGTSWRQVCLWAIKTHPSRCIGSVLKEGWNILANC